MAFEVSVAAAECYSDDALQAAVHRHFAELAVAELVTPETKVLLKPNLLMKRKPEEATTTHPALVGAVVRELQTLGVRDITIADSPGGPYTKAHLDEIYRVSGMADVAEQTGAALARTTDWQSVHCETRAGFCREFNLITPVTQADVIINLPKLKTHAMTTMSGAVKNLFGCVPGLQKPELHFRFPERERFCRMLIELSQFVSPALTIVDAVDAMEGDGPSGGTPRHVGITIASRDVYALDLALSRLIGFAPDEVDTVRLAAEQGLSPAAYSEIVYLADGEPPVIHDFAKPSSAKSLTFSDHAPAPLRRLIGLLQTPIAPKPRIRRRDCIGCGKCAESCPAKIIRITDGKAVIDAKRCIRCFCCHEMCPVRAIDIKRFGFWNL